MSSFVDMAPKRRVDLVEEALDALSNKNQPEHQAALKVLRENTYTSTQIAEVFRGMGFEEITAPRVRHYRRKLKEEGSK